MNLSQRLKVVLDQFLLQPKVLIVLLLSLLGILFFKRFQWDSGISPLIQSDSQIKLYQVVEYKRKGLGAHECYNEKNVNDENYRFFPFRYPWAFFVKDASGDAKCYFQYPSFFAQIFSLVPLSYRYFNSCILVLYISLCFFAVYFIYKIFELKKLPYLLLSSVLMLVGYGISSAIEFSESMMAQLFLLSIYLSIFTIEKKNRSSNVVLFLSGFLGGFAIFLRSESLFYIGIPYAILLIQYRSKLKELIINHFFILTGFSFSLILFGFYNYTQFQEFLGIRSRVSYNDFFRIDFGHRLHLIWQYFFGDENRVGFVFYCFPIVILLTLSLFKFELNRIQKFLFYSSTVSFIFIVLFSPYSSGGLYLGMRFTEFSYILFCIFLISLLETSRQNGWSYLLIGLLFLQLLLGIFHVRRNFKTIDYVKKYHEIFQSKLDEYANAPVIHLSTFDLLLVSDSFLKKPHYITKNLNEFNVLESKLIQSGVKQIQVFFYDFKPPRDLNASDEFYKEWIDTKFEIQSKFYKVKSDETIAGFRLMVWTAK